MAVDPLYGSSADTLARHVQFDFGPIISQMNGTLFRKRSFPSFDTADADRCTSAVRFLADYALHFVHGRHVGGVLPRLPFFDDSSDLVLGAHLRFTCLQWIDSEWQVAVSRELARVSAGGVRIHPVWGADGKPYPKLAVLRKKLRAGGIESGVIRMDYEFFIGSRSTLVFNKGSS